LCISSKSFMTTSFLVTSIFNIIEIFKPIYRPLPFHSAGPAFQTPSGNACIAA
jgi:hypothetical protein